MKRIFVSAMALVMLAGCASKPTTTETPVASAQATTTPEAVDVLTENEKNIRKCNGTCNVSWLCF